MDLLLPHFPNSVGGRVISFLRIAKSGDTSFVVRVTNQNKKYGEIIARCGMGRNLVDGSYVFITTIEHSGHMELCRLLRRNGIKGNYLEWLKAVENGDESLAEEKKELSLISFDCDTIEEKEASGWKLELGEKFVEAEISS